MPSVSCPNCGKPVEWNAASHWRPFCSERCRLIDLGEWMNESHRIAGESTGEDEETAQEPPGQTD